MNHGTTGLIVSKASTGYLHYKIAEGLAIVKADGYDRDLKWWMNIKAI